MQGRNRPRRRHGATLPGLLPRTMTVEDLSKLVDEEVRKQLPRMLKKHQQTVRFDTRSR